MAELVANFVDGQKGCKDTVWATHNRELEFFL
jgi:hypothetical protein